MHSLHSPFCLLALAMDAGNGSFLDHVVTRPNLRRALRHVVAKRGAPGVDGMTVHQLAAAWPKLEDAISQQLLSGVYAPSAIRRCAIPKAGGKGIRVLGIPTVLDRSVQQAIARPLSALLDEGFSPHSFAFRHGRCAHDALLQSARFVGEGKQWVLHLDLERFFDLASHALVLARLWERVPDARLLELVRRFLSAPFAIGHRQLHRSTGLPQGGPLSPLLANLLLDGLDQRLFDAGYDFCRYADDISLYFHSPAEASEALSMVAPWIEVDLKLRINRSKTRIGPVPQDVFLGYRLGMSKGRIAFTPSSDSRARLRFALRRLLEKSRTENIHEIIGRAVVPLLRGWTRYFSLTEDPCVWLGIGRLVDSEIRRGIWRRARRTLRHVCSNCNPDNAASTSEWKIAVRIASRDFGFYERQMFTESSGSAQEIENAPVKNALLRVLGLPELPSMLVPSSLRPSPESDIRGCPTARDCARCDFS